MTLPETIYVVAIGDDVSGCYAADSDLGNFAEHEDIGVYTLSAVKRLKITHELVD